MTAPDPQTGSGHPDEHDELCGETGCWRALDEQPSGSSRVQEPTEDTCNCQAIPGTENFPGPWHPKGDPTCVWKKYRHDLDYLADQLRQYIDRTMQEGVDYMRGSVGHLPEFADLLKGYEDAMADVQKMLRDPGHQFHRGLARYITAAREVSRG